jgi:hypothetical protein
LTGTIPNQNLRNQEIRIMGHIRKMCKHLIAHTRDSAILVQRVSIGNNSEDYTKTPVPTKKPDYNGQG